MHCPPGTKHVIVGAGDGPCVVLAVGGRDHITEDCNGGAYTFDEVADRHGASIEPGTTADQAYAHFEPSEPTPYREGLLPGE